MAGDRGLPHALPGAYDRKRRERKRRQLGRVETKVRAHIRQPEREHPARHPEAFSRPEHRLVGEVDDDLGLELGDRRFQLVHDRHAVVVTAAQLLGAAGEPDGHELVRQHSERIAHHGRIVLPVGYGQRPHQVLAVTSSSIRVVYFSNASVSVENWMIRSEPWNGYLRQTSTCRSVISITL